MLLFFSIPCNFAYLGAAEVARSNKVIFQDYFISLRYKKDDQKKWNAEFAVTDWRLSSQLLVCLSVLHEVSASLHASFLYVHLWIVVWMEHFRHLEFEEEGMVELDMCLWKHHKASSTFSYATWMMEKLFKPAWMEYCPPWLVSATIRAMIGWLGIANTEKTLSLRGLDLAISLNAGIGDSAAECEMIAPVAKWP